ncbi:MAG: hypothetical protein A3B96_02080 [Candidatus Spechtbacteria bacterium RIFCSPHIGHO2_02_FULL_43_15b]|nr:MAG: hypothetical protein A3B96_02080 [Candidatus Spechtbacteria bacterium RIFCSPHIGHO2_02_FULL_43_15b]
MPILPFVVFGVFFAIPSDAQVNPLNHCLLFQEISVDGIVLLKGSDIKSGPDDIVDLDKGTGINSPTDPIIGVEGGVSVGVPTSDWGAICLIDSVNKIVDWMFFILLTVAFTFIVIAGFMWIVSAGSSEKQQAAGKMIVAALVGIVIALFAKILPAILLGIVT